MQPGTPILQLREGKKRRKMKEKRRRRKRKMMSREEELQLSVSVHVCVSVLGSRQVTWPNKVQQMTKQESEWAVEYRK